MRLFALLLLVSIVCVSAQTDSFCVKYAKALSGKTAATLTGADEFNFISAIIGRLVVGCDNNAAARYGVPGISATTGPFRFYAKSACGDNGVDKVIGLIADPTNAPFFTGFAPNYDSVTGLQALNDAANVTLGPSIRFVDLDGTNVTAYNAAAGIPGAEGLIQHLVSFFGRDFKCSFYDPTTSSTDGTFIGRYAGNDQVGRVHKYMNITKVVWDNFASAFVSTLLSFGVAQSDIDTSIVPYVTQFLQVPPGGDIAKQVCNHPTCECISGFKNVNNVCVATCPAPTAPPKNINTGTIMTISPMVALATIGLIALL